MPSVFTRIIRGELPSHTVHEDDRCVVFLSINPLNDGHALVVPREEVDHWLDLDGATLAHLTEVAQRVGRAQMRAFRPARIASMIVGFEVPHVHIHLVPMNALREADFSRAPASVPDDRLRENADRLRAALAGEVA